MEIGEQEGQDHKPGAIELYKRITKLNWLVYAGRRQSLYCPVGQLLFGYIYAN